MSIFFRVENPVEGTGRLPVPALAAGGAADGLTSRRSANLVVPGETGRDDTNTGPERFTAKQQPAGGLTPAPQPQFWPELLDWLQNLLRERFHGELVLRPSPQGFHELTVSGSTQRVAIRSDLGVFHASAPDMPCTMAALDQYAWLSVEWMRLPAPGMAELSHPLVEPDEHGCVLHYDVLGLAYWMLSRREEIGSTKLDPHQRFPAEASHAFRHGYLERPLVDEWFEVLRAIMRAVWPELPLKVQRYEIRLTHDVDTPARYALFGAWRLGRTMLVDLLRDRQRDRAALLRAPWIWAGSKHRLDPRDPFNTFDWIMDRSEEMGLRNAFYFICGHTDARRDGHYSPEQPAILELMGRIHARGHEIGLHSSYNTYLDPQALCTEAARLRRACERAGVQQERIGNRMHYLRWNTPATLHGLEAAGLAYDTTLGWAKHPGFRTGTCHEYQAFDPLLGKALKLRLRPLIVMESTVMQRLTPATVPDVAARLQGLMDACRRVQGCFTLLWHNTMLEHDFQRRLYERVLQHHKEATQ